jgi:2-keto-4-pentenoate hydratase/2-oxohepta-3-ene-1,7-dioic acid hydratase in catechol pathway
MKFLSFRTDSGPSWGLANGDRVTDLGRRYPQLASLRAALGSGEWEALRRAWDGKDAADYALDEIRFEPVVPDAEKIICIGLNYEDHRIESKRDKASYPTIFARTADSQVGNGAPLLLPPESDMLDFEGELAVIIGTECRRVPVERAMDVVVGYACYNDASVRDYQRHTSQFHPGKNWPATGGFGPQMVTCDEIEDLRRLTIQTRLNGEVVQEGTLDQLIFSVPELIAYCSTWTVLRPGDVIVTGTPSGVGAARQPPLWMKDGDVVEVDIPNVGLLRNRVEREVPAVAAMAS